MLLTPRVSIAVIHSSGEKGNKPAHQLTNMSTHSAKSKMYCCGETPDPRERLWINTKLES